MAKLTWVAGAGRGCFSWNQPRSSRSRTRPKAEMVSRNVVRAISPPKVEAVEVEALTAPQISEVLTKIAGRRLYPIVVLALGTGMRRGELLALISRQPRCELSAA